jgi:hypothetical protein
MSKFTVGQRGWLAWLEAYPVEVEYLGEGYYQPDCPSDPSRFYRALTEVKRNEGFDVEVGHIVEENGACTEQLFATRDEAAKVCQESATYWLKRKEQELEALRARANV